MKRLMSLILTAVLVISSIRGICVFADTTVVPVMSEDFESGTFEVKTNDANTVKEIYKGSELILTYAKTNGSAFVNFPTQPVATVNSNPGNNSLVNTSVALATNPYVMTDTIAYINFPQKYDNGILNIDFRMQRPSSGQKWVWTNLTQDEVKPEEYTGSYAVKSYTRTASSTAPNVEVRAYKNSSEYDVLNYNTSALRNASKGYNHVKMIVDLDNSKVSIYSKTGNSGNDDVYTDYRIVAEDMDFYANDDSTTADGVSALIFESNGSTLGLDNIVITHETTELGEVAPTATNVTISGRPYPGEVLTGTYGKYTDLNGDEESGSVAVWYAADDAKFTTNVTTLKTEPITAGSTSSYTLTTDEKDRYIRFGVTPKNNAAENNTGEEVFAALGEIVRIPQTKPVITLLTPSNNSTIYQGATIFLTVDAKCDGAEITKVEYFANDNLIATATQAPYSATWASDELEDYAVYAKAYNNLGEITDSETAYISIKYYDETNETTEDGAQIIFKDDFETGAYTVTSGVEEAGNHYKEVYKNGKLHWTVAKNGSDAFTETFPEELIVSGSDSAENETKYFSLGGKHTDGVKVWHNLDEAVTSGIVNLDIRMMHTAPSSNDYPTCISFYDAPFTGYVSSPKKIFEVRMTKVSAGARIRYSWPWKSDSSRGDSTGNTATTNPSSGHWIDFKISVNLDTQKVKFYMKPYNSDEYIPFRSDLAGYDLNFYANCEKASTATTGTFTRAEQIAAIGFDGNSKGVMAPLTNAILEFDDVVISRVASTISFLKEDGVSSFDNILAGNKQVYAKTIFTNSEDAPKDINLIIAAYDSYDKLISIATGEQTYSIAKGETKEILTPLPVDDNLIKNAAKLKSFAWNPATMEYYMDKGEAELTQDVIGDKKLDIYLLMGQSNMSGRAPYTNAEGVYMNRAYLFNNNNRWSEASNPLNKFSILGDSSAQIAMGPSYTFAKTLTEYIPDLQLGLVVNAKGGSNIAQWQKGTFYYENSIAKAKEAMKYGEIKGIIWHQGCSNSSKWDEYMPQLQQLVSDLRADLGDETIPFIAGQLNPSNENKANFNTMITTISDNIPYSSYAKADDLTTIDGTHFDAASQRILGQRYATEILRMNYGITGRVFEEGNINLATGADAIASTSYSSYAPANATDDNTDTYWQAYKTGSTVTEMPYYILDLGKERNINYITLTDKQSDVTNDTKINLEVQLSNDPAFATYTTIGNNEDNPVYQKTSWTCRNAATGTYQYIRIIKTQPGNLGFAEIKVIGN